MRLGISRPSFRILCDEKKKKEYSKKQGAAFSGIPPLCPHDTAKAWGVMHHMSQKNEKMIGIEALSIEYAQP